MLINPSASSKNGKRLLIVYDVAYPFVKGGMQRRFFEVAQRLAKKGWVVEWVSFQTWIGDREVLSDGIRYIGLAGYSGLYGAKGKRKALEPIQFLLQLIKEIPKRQRYDVVWTMQWPMLHLFLLMFITKEKNTLLVVDWLEVWGASWLKYSRTIGWIGWILEMLLLKLLKKKAVIVTDSSREKISIEKFLKCPDKVHYIPNGIPVDELRTSGPISGPKFDIGYLGRLKNHKRVDLLLSALVIAREDLGHIFTASIIGDGPEKEALEKFVMDNDLTRAVTFHGLVPESSECYALLKSCQLVAVTTTNGGGGNVTIMEAYGCGLPVIGFRCDEGLDPELIDKNETGLLVEPITARALAEGLVKILKDQKKYNELIINVKKIEGQLSWDNSFLKYQELFLY